MQKKLEDLLLDSVHAVSKISPSTFLNVRYESLVATLQFIKATPEAAYADKALRNLFAEQKGVLDAHSLEAFFQIVGEMQFWMLAVKKEILLTRIPVWSRSRH